MTVSREQLAAAARTARDAVDLTAAFVGGLSWESYDPDLREFADPQAEAVSRSAEDAALAVDAYLEAVSAYCGKDTQADPAGLLASQAGGNR